MNLTKDTVGDAVKAFFAGLTLGFSLICALVQACYKSTVTLVCHHKSYRWPDGDRDTL